MTAPHPAAAPLIDAARALAAYQPADAEDLARLLRSIHDLTGRESLLNHLSAALYRWANDQAGNYRACSDQIIDHLSHADELLGPLGEAIDRAREATGHWNAGGDGADQ